MRPKSTLIAASLLFAAAATLPATASAKDIATDWFGRAIAGYDTTSYFTRGKPNKGQSAHTFKWQGATWRFATKRGRDLFAANPGKYAPQFGGHCSNGLADGHLVKADAQIWMMIKGKLYMFYAERGRKRWQASSNVNGLIAKARANWKRLKPSAK